MEFVFVIALIVMLLAVAYAQWNRGVVKTIGNLPFEDEKTNY